MVKIDSNLIALFAIALVACWTTGCAATDTRDDVAVTAYYSRYNSAGTDGGSGAVSGVPMPSTEEEVSLRLQAIFNVEFVDFQFQHPEVGNSSEYQDEISGLGLGMKIDLPGFFMIGGTKEEASREWKMWPVNTFVYLDIVRATLTDLSTGAKTNETVPFYGLGADFFIFNPYIYLTTKLSLLNLVGSTYLSYAAGLGFRF